MIKKTGSIGQFIQGKFPELKSIYRTGLQDDDIKIPPIPDINNYEKILFETSGPSGAAAYVSSDDRNKNGLIDTVTIVIPGLEQHKTFDYIKKNPQIFKELQTKNIKSLLQKDSKIRGVVANMLLDLGALFAHEIEGHIGPGGAKGRDPYGESHAQSKEKAYISMGKVPPIEAIASEDNDFLVKKEIAKLTDALADLEEYSLAKSAYKISSEIKKTSSDDNSGKKLSGEDLKNLTALLEKQFLR